MDYILQVFIKAIMIIRIKIIIFFVALLHSQNLFSRHQLTDYSFQAGNSLKSAFEQNNEDSDQVKNLLALAWNKYNLAFDGNGKFEEAMAYATQSLVLAKQINYKPGIGRGNFVLGMCFAGRGDYINSRQYHYNTLKIALEQGDKVQVLKEYYHIGIACNMLGLYNEALENHFAALKIIRKINANESYPDAYAGIGNVYLNMKNYPEAHKYLEDAYTLAAKQQAKPLMGEMLLYLGNSLLAQTKFDAAVSRYTSALIFLNDQKSKRHLVGVYYGMAEVFLKKANMANNSSNEKKYFTTSINYLTKTLALDRQMSNTLASIRDYSKLIEAYTGIEDYKNALTYYDLYTQSLDSPGNNSPYLKISELKIKYDREIAAAEFAAKREKEKMIDQARQAEMLAEQMLMQERALGAEKNKYEKSIGEERIRQEKIKAERQQMNYLFLMGLMLVIVTAVFTIFYFKQRSEKRRVLEKAEAIYKMAELEMQSLRSQLNPHFMFNSLNAIQTLILKNENDRSQSYLARFARLLRILLENADSPFITLQKEVEFLQLYLGLENLRVPDLEYAVSTESTLDAGKILIPNMLLQPYVENAIWHGLSHKPSDKKLQIRIYKEGEAVHYEIEDNGVGRKKAEEFKSLFRKQHQSKGMELIDKRIKLLNAQYTTAIHTEITDVMIDNEVSGTLVTIKIPLNLIEPFQNR